MRRVLKIAGVRRRIATVLMDPEDDILDPDPVAQLQAAFDKARRTARFRQARAGTNTWELELADRFEAVGCSTSVRSGGRYGMTGWNRNNCRHFFRVLMDWEETVSDQGIAVIARRLTLAAATDKRPSNAQDGDRIYRARWAQQGRGLTVVCHEGWIAKAAELAAHSEESAASAVRALRSAERKIVNAETAKATRVLLKAAGHG